MERDTNSALPHVSHGFTKTVYEKMNSRQKENYNAQKLSARLADYGFNCLRLSDDWEGADLIACHINGSTFLKIQLKGRLAIDKKYAGKDIWIAFPDQDDWYVYPHDTIRDALLDVGLMTGSRSWDEFQAYSWPYLTKAAKKLLEGFRL